MSNADLKWHLYYHQGSDPWLDYIVSYEQDLA